MNNQRTAAPTPGPWCVQKLNHCDGELWLQIGYEKPDGTKWGPICRISSPAEPLPDGVVAEIKYMATSNANQLANARLIAAAPDLLAACEAAVAADEAALEELYKLRPEFMHELPHNVTDQLRAAIAKAKGTT